MIESIQLRKTMEKNNIKTMILINHHDQGDLNPAFYWALEHYLLTHLRTNDVIYFFTWKVKGVISGKNQVIENEVNFDYVNKHKIPVYRRPSGGGTVYADENNLMFSIVKRKSKDTSFKEELNRIVKALNDMNIPATFSGRNDMLIGDKKISGNSFLQTKDGMVIHGTLLFDTDLDTMIKAITPSSEKLVSKGIESIRSRVTNIKTYTNLSLDHFREQLEQNLTTQKVTLTQETIWQLSKDAKKYLTTDWIYYEQPLYTKKVTQRFEFGSIELYLDINYKKIKNITIKGDYFELQDIHQLEHQLIDLELNIDQIANRFESIKVSNYIMNASNDDLSQLLTKAILYE